MRAVVGISKGTILIIFQRRQKVVYRCRNPPPPATMNNNIPKKTDEVGRVASCIISPNMLDEDGLNGEIKCPPPEIL